PRAPGGTSAFFAYLNLNKRGIVLDLASPAGSEALLALVRDADVVVESFAPGHLDALRLGYETLRGANPRLVLTSVTLYGQTGPWASRPGNDLTAFAASGWAVANATQGGSPLKGPGYQASFVAAQN